MIFSLRGSQTALNVGKLLDEKLNALYQYSDNKEEVDGEPQVKYRPDRATILILDRTFDLAAPLMHSYWVMSLVEEVLEGSPSELIADEKVRKTCFNEEDPYWQLFKSNNVGAAQLDLEE